MTRRAFLVAIGASLVVAQQQRIPEFASGRLGRHACWYGPVKLTREASRAIFGDYVIIRDPKIIARWKAEVAKGLTAGLNSPIHGIGEQAVKAAREFGTAFDAVRAYHR